MYLNATTDKLEIVLGGTVATNQLNWNVSYQDITSSGMTLPQSAGAGLTNNTTPIDIVAAPAASTTRQVTHINVFNADTATATVTIQKDVSGTNYVLISYSVVSGDTLMWSREDGWRLMSAAGGAIVLTGDVTGTGTSSIATTIANDAVTYAKIQNVSAASRLLGRGSAGGAGDVEEVTLGTNLSMSGTTLNATGGGVSTIGTIDSQTKAANGAVITGSSLVMQTADATNPGLISTGAQTIAGAKTFSSAPTFSSLTAGSVLFAGAGGLVSQDNANLFWDNTNKRLGIGTATPVGRIEISSDTADSIYYASSFSNTATTGSATIIRRARGTAASPLAVQSGDRLGTYTFSGYNGSSYAFSASIIANAAENFGANSGSNFSFENTPIGSNTRRAVATLFASGNLLIQNGGTFTDAGFRLDVNGTARVQERLTISDDSAVTTQTSAVIAAEGTNANLVLRPNGTGALVANIPDNGTAGGIARGPYAVDLQMLRTANTQVANGNWSVISGGYQNTASGNFSTSSGGQSNIASGSHSFVGGGQSNSNAAQHGFLGGGNGNTLGIGSTEGVLVGGNGCNNTGFRGAIVGGRNSIVSGTYGIVCGGNDNQSVAAYTTCIGGERSRAYLHGQTAKAAGTFNGNGGVGDAQTSSLTFRREITGQNIQELFLDGASLRAILALPTGATNARAWRAQIDVVAICATAGGTTVLNDVFAGSYHCAIKRVGTTTSLVGAVSVTNEVSDTSMSTSVVTITADDTNEALKIEFTPPTTANASTVIRVVATAYLTEVGR